MRKYLIGFLLGAMLCSALPSLASVEQFILSRADYKVFVNNAEYENTDYPTMTYEGTTYVPLKKLADLLGVDVKWNEKMQRAEISNTVATVKPTPIPTPNITPQSLTFYKKDGSDYANNNGNLYIHYLSAINLVIAKNRLFQIGYIRETPLSTNGAYCLQNLDTNQIILNNIQTTKFDGKDYIEYGYFQNTVLSLVK